MVRKLHVLFSACMLSLAVALPQAAVGAGLDPRLYVIVSNQAKVPADLIDDAISELSRIYRTIGVELTAGTALPADFTGSFVAVTIARSRQCRLMRLSELALGSAVPGGTLAFVMYDRVVTLSSRAGLRQSEALALVMTDNRLPLVICVDDDEAMLGTVVRCLKREKIEVRSTLSASEALSWIASLEVAVLVSDYDMPEMTGAQLAGHAKRVRPETVRILLTGQRSLETAIDGINQGEIFKFLNKPFDNEQLRGAVHAGVARNKELLAMSGDRQRRERRNALHAALESEYPGISQVSRTPGEVYEVTDDPLTEAAVLGLSGLVAGLESP